MSPNKYFPKYSEDNGQHTLTLGDEEVLSCDTQSSVENMFLALSRESKIKALAEKVGVHNEVKSTQVQETLPMVCHQTIPALPKSPSSPDVIIEEIFEDDLESKFLNTRCFKCSFVEHHVMRFVLCCVFLVSLSSCKFFNDVRISLCLPLS